MLRRDFLTALAALTATAPVRAGAVGAEMPFSTDLLMDRVRAMARERYRPRPMVPEAWRNLTYDQYRKIWFAERNALWSGEDSAIKVDFFAPGLYFPRAIKVFAVEGDVAAQVPFSLDDFDTTDKFPDLPVDDTLGFSGFRLRAETERAGIFQEFLVMQGGTYFRGIGTGQIYGISARGLAIDTADPKGEEFPDFTEFYIERPAAGARVFNVHAILDSPGVAGLYSFEIAHGLPLRMRVTARLIPRRRLTHVGLGPLTSMFQFDGTNRDRFSDFRPAVHDSDGLMIRNGRGETLWRPLANPKTLQVSAFIDDNPRGFGLMQRARKFSDFADLEALYHRRPSLWITPEGDWGKGAVTLVEIPTEREIYDNIVAYWRPETALEPGVLHSHSYAMDWGETPPGDAPLAQVVDTRMGRRYSGGYIATIDFAPHPGLGDLADLTPSVSAKAGQVSDGLIQQNPETGGPRLAFSFDPEGAPLIEFRAQLRKAGAPASEVWLYRWTPT
ncbi:MAG: glucan biosynthesis protein [Rhodobacteraceae bacterium]|nr:glucan biosynthesis protein [Paracoccaceae bacterium]